MATPPTDLAALGMNLAPSDFAQVLASLQGTLGGIDAAPGPELRSVPPSNNPFASALSTFGASMAQQLGVRGALPMNERRLERQQDAVRQAENQNFALTEADRRERQKGRLQVLLQMAEVQAMEAEQQGDMALMYKKLQEQERIDEKLKKMELEGRKEIARINAGAALTRKQTPTGNALLTQEEGEDTLDLKRKNDATQAYLDDVANAAEVEDGVFIGPFEIGQKDKLRPGALTERRQRAIITIKTAPFKETKVAALQVYYFSLLDENGDFDKTSREANILLGSTKPKREGLIDKVLETDAEKLEFLQSIGLIQ